MRYAFLFACVVATTTLAQQKKLIEFGWDEPDTAFMRQHIAQMEQTPFDGTVFTAYAYDNDKKQLNFMNECWGTTAFKGAGCEDEIVRPIRGPSAPPRPRDHERLSGGVSKRHDLSHLRLLPAVRASGNRPHKTRDRRLRPARPIPRRHVRRHPRRGAHR